MMSGHTSNTEIAISAFGLPCLDQIVKVSNMELLDKYRLPYNGQMNIDKDTFLALQNDIKKKNYEVINCPGGCAQNTVRIFKQLDKSLKKNVIFGAVGNDYVMELMKKQVEQSGVVVRYVPVKGAETALIIILVRENTRCCAGTLCNDYLTVEKCDNFLSDEDKRLMASSQIVHIDGFFVYTNSTFSLNLLADVVDEIVLSFNIAATFFIEQYRDVLMSVCRSCDLLICNKDEFEILTNATGGLSDDGEEFADKIVKFHRATMLDGSSRSGKKQLLKECGKILIVTDGSNPVHCVYGNGELIVHDVPPVASDLIVDTTGAGDSFLAGFLYGLTCHLDIRKSLTVACEVAKIILFQPGLSEESLNYLKTHEFSLS